jgi:prepilin-type processing-associated H-X9-DG protein
LRVGLTNYLGVLGTNLFRNDGVLFEQSRIRLNDITDGTTNTLMIGERPPSPDQLFGWWYAGWGQDKSGSMDLTLGVRERSVFPGLSMCPQGPFHFQAGDLKNSCDIFHFWSPHPGGAHFAFCDGSVRFLAYSADSIMPALATRAGGEAVGVPD